MGKTHITIEYMVKRKRKRLSRSVLAGTTIYRQYRQWIKPSLNENYRRGGFVTTIGGLIIMLGYENYRRGVHHNDRGANHNVQLLWYAPGGVNPNDKTVMINPPRGVPQRGG